MHRPENVSIRPRPDGWSRVFGIPGWDTHAVTVHVEVVEGEPRVTSLHLDAVDGVDSPALTGLRLRSLPLRDIAIAAMSEGVEQDHVFHALTAISTQAPVKHDKRASTSVEQVAEVYRLARVAGRPGRTEVVNRLNISTRTADRYLARARAAGLLDLGTTGTTGDPE